MSNDLPKPQNIEVGSDAGANESRGFSGADVYAGLRDDRMAQTERTLPVDVSNGLYMLERGQFTDFARHYNSLNVTVQDRIKEELARAHIQVEDHRDNLPIGTVGLRMRIPGTENLSRSIVMSNGRIERLYLGGTDEQTSAYVRNNPRERSPAVFDQFFRNAILDIRRNGGYGRA